MKIQYNKCSYMSLYHCFNKCLQCYTFKFQRYLKSIYTVTKNWNICNWNVWLDIWIICLVFMSNNTFNIRPVYISPKYWQPTHPEYCILSYCNNYENIQQLPLIKTPSPNVCFFNRILTPSILQLPYWDSLFL